MSRLQLNLRLCGFCSWISEIEYRVCTGPWSVWKHLKFITDFLRPWKALLFRLNFICFWKSINVLQSSGKISVDQFYRVCKVSESIVFATFQFLRCCIRINTIEINGPGKIDLLLEISWILCLVFCMNPVYACLVAKFDVIQIWYLTIFAA